MPRYVIAPGEQHAGEGSFLVSTLLGSCVAACLFDPVAKVAGMNHFLLANRRYAKDKPLSITEAGRYGMHAMELLINEMTSLGAQKKRMRAKAFGGGAVLDVVGKDNFLCVGDVNARFVREYLETENIPLDASDLGGELGRVIRFRTDTYAVYQRYIKKTSTFVVETKERGYWKRSIERHKIEEREPTSVILFR